ncbi:hypothetical protein [Ammoniphilus sp. 3BR4]|uniref:hypothetical protein n=1 Tax=Ammoniphilus sp. 3BR4 TaxID=3158265 RepID=UPI00346779F4
MGRKHVELKLDQVTYGHDTSAQKEFEEIMIKMIKYYLQQKSKASEREWSHE